MKPIFSKSQFTAFLAAGIFSVSAVAFGAIADENGEKQISPIRFSADQIAGKNLPESDHQIAKKRGNPREIISQAKEKPRVAVLFAGDIVGIVYESGPAKFRLENNLYDEFIQVQEGTLILTTKETGKAEKFEAGDTLVMPKGWNGTWEMKGETFRELVVIETKTHTEDANAE